MNLEGRPGVRDIFSAYYRSHFPQSLDGTISLMDIAPTVLTAFGIETEGMHGRPISELL